MTTIYGTPTGSQEIILTDSTPKGITAGLAGSNNERTVLVQAINNGIRYTLHDPNATPTSCDFYLSCGSMIAVTPASHFRFISESGTDGAIKVQAFE